MSILFRSFALRHLVVGVLLIGPLPVFSATCLVKSTSTRATVIELFTSEGCSSCPPADRWLSGFVGKAGGEAPVVPLAFHVDYWDYLGWPDRFASPRFSQRQAERVASGVSRFAYTPQTVIDGRDSTVWRQAPRPGELPVRSTRTADASLLLRLDTGAGGRITADLQAILSNPGDEGRVVAYLALYENGLSSEVSAGENSGRNLRHDFVVREWIGPLPIMERSGAVRHAFMRPDVVFENAGIAAILESADGRRQLQAVALPLCR